MSLLSIMSNNFWTMWARLPEAANAPTLWNFDSNGFVSPSTDPSTGQPRGLSTAEQQQMGQYNSERSQLNAANRAAVDAILGRFLPISDTIYSQLPDATAMQFISDASWLADHEQGSEFYNNPDNFTGLPGTEFDYMADHLWARFHNTLVQSCLAIDYSEVEQKVSTGVSTPIVIDLDGDGIETTSFLAGPTVMFDIDGDNVKDRTAWLSGKDAFLAVDKNGNGVIDGVNELFGGPNRGDGFAKLIEFDSNMDGVVDQHDDKFADLLLWQDRNVDGHTDEGEITSASSAGLSSISTNYSVFNGTNNGNILGEVSTAVLNGEETSAVDVYFRFSAGTDMDTTSSNSKNASLISAMANFSARGAGDIINSPLDAHKLVPAISANYVSDVL